LKKIIFKITCITAFFLFIPYQDALPNIYADFMGVYNNAGDAEAQYGYGFLAGVDISKDVSFVARGIMTSISENEKEPDEAKYSHKMFMGGIGYGYNIPAYRLVWRSFLLLGYSETDVEERVNYVKSKTDDSGLCVEITTGIQWNATQHVAPFVDIGYHQSYYTGNLQDASIGGFQAMAGIRFYIFNVKSIDEDY
jgi:hypothetical protein